MAQMKIQTFQTQSGPIAGRDLVVDEPWFMPGLCRAMHPNEPERDAGAGKNLFGTSANEEPNQTLDIADPRILSWWTDTDLRTNCLYQSDAPLGLTCSFGLLTCAHTAWKSTSASLSLRTSGRETVENLKISPGQLAPCQEKQIKRQHTVSSA